MYTKTYPQVSNQEYYFSGKVLSGTADTVLEPDDFDGYVTEEGSVLAPARTLWLRVFTRSGLYVPGSTITVEGLDPVGKAISEVFIIGTEDGQGDSENSTLFEEGDGFTSYFGQVAFREVTRVVVQQQVEPGEGDDPPGFSMGVRDIILGSLSGISGMRTGGFTFNVKVQYETGQSDIVTISNSMLLPITPVKIFGDSDTNVTNLTLFFGCKI